MCNVLKPERQKRVLHMLAEGNSVRSTERLTGSSPRHNLPAGGPIRATCKRFMDAQLRGLTLQHVEVDEIWTFVEKKQGRLTAEEKAERYDIGDVYLWTALDKHTKLVPSFVVGKRSADNARKLMVDLPHRLVMPNPHASDPHGYKPGGYVHITQISTDGFSGLSGSR